MTQFRLKDLIEKADEAYQKYGDIQVAIRINDKELMPILQIGIAGDSEERTADNTFFCLAPNLIK